MFENYVDGMMGGYFIYEEMLIELECMYDFFFEFIMLVILIDIFIIFEGCFIYWFCIFDNVVMDEFVEFKVLYMVFYYVWELNSFF